MKLTDAERLILANQYQILKHLDPAQASSYSQYADALLGGYEHEYAEIDNRLARGESAMSPDECRFVRDVMTMHEALQRTAASQDNDIERDDVVFRGFDRATEKKYLNYARFLRADRRRVPNLKVKDIELDSQEAMLPVYQRMLGTYELAADPAELTSDEALAILDAKAWQP
jgi:uncharacterized protein YfbU (UPF0304 family)